MKKRLAIHIAIFVFAYFLGLLTIQYKLPPYSFLKAGYRAVHNGRAETKLLDQHFVDPVSRYDKLKYPPVTTLEELAKRINEFMVNIDSFENAYELIEVLSSSIDGHILTLEFQYMQSSITAYAYFKPAVTKSMTEVGITVIPGSGINQSSAMFYDKPNNYQSNIDDISQRYGDVYILVKPNEDFLAIHNGKKKISEVSFVNHLLNNGASYSAYYIIQGLALSKFIKQKYEELYVCGLSQGGFAALINSLQSRPQKAVIASGFSVLMNQPYRSAHSQIIIPKHREVYNPEGVKAQIEKSDTQFLFTWGQQEKGLYGKDAKEELTSKFFMGMTNVQAYIHREGHVYYPPVIIKFFEHKG